MPKSVSQRNRFSRQVARRTSGGVLAPSSLEGAPPPLAEEAEANPEATRTAEQDIQPSKTEDWIARGNPNEVRVAMVDAGTRFEGEAQEAVARSTQLVQGIGEAGMATAQASEAEAKGALLNAKDEFGREVHKLLEETTEEEEPEITIEMEAPDERDPEWEQEIGARKREAAPISEAEVQTEATAEQAGETSKLAETASQPLDQVSLEADIKGLQEKLAQLQTVASPKQPGRFRRAFSAAWDGLPAVSTVGKVIIALPAFGLWVAAKLVDKLFGLLDKIILGKEPKKTSPGSQH